MKKTLISLFVILASAGYVAYQYLGGGSSSALATTSPAATTTQSPAASDQTAQTQAAPSTTSQPTVATVQPTTNTTSDTTPAPAPVATPSPVPVTKPTGQYVDGTYTGSSADAYYGTVQVQAVISGGKLTAVKFLQYPSDRRTSQSINGSAMPALESEAIQAQSANVNAVSGATDTTQAFEQSLESALAQAKNS